LKVNVNLIKGLKDEEKQRVISQAEYSKDLIKALTRALEEKIQSCYIEEENNITSDVAKYTASLGYRRGLREALNMLPGE
jgi:hypothetical protein